MKDLPILIARRVLLAELDRVTRLRLALLQIPDDEVLILVDGEELAQPGSEAGLLRLLVGLGVFLGAILLKIQLAPLDLRNGGAARLVPDRQRLGVFSVEHTDGSAVVRGEQEASVVYR